MGNIRPVAEIVIDDPCLDGRIAENGHHYGRNWEAAYSAEDPASEPWQHAGCEYIESMKCLLPRAVIHWSDMLTDSWSDLVGEDNWFESRPAITKPRVKFLHFVKNGPGEYGIVQSLNEYRPGVYFRLFRQVPVDGETLAPYAIIEMVGAAGADSYALVLPWGDVDAEEISISGETTETFDEPRLYRYSDDEPLDPDYPIASLPATSTGATIGSEPLVQDVAIEQLDNYMRIMISRYDDWLIEDALHPLTRGILRVTFGGHTGMFNVQPILWPATAATRPVHRRTIPAWMDAHNTMYWVGYQPPGTEIAVAEDVLVGSGGGPDPECVAACLAALESCVAGCGDDPECIAACEVAYNACTASCEILPERAVRPAVTFTGDYGAELRPLLYRVQHHTTPQIYTAESDPGSISPVKVSWHRNNEWRGASFDAEFQDFESVQELQPNARAELKIAWDTGGEAPTPTTRIIGYLDGSHRQYTGSFAGKAQPTIRANDHPQARLADLKFMRDMPSFELRNAPELFAWLLSTVGVRSEMISVDEAVTESYIVARSTPPWEPHFLYEDDFGFIQAMDAIFVDYFGLQWGWNESGYFLRPRPTYSGTPDWTMDYDTTQMADMVSALNVERAFDEMRNYVMVKSPAGSAIIADRASHVDPVADNYVADDRWDISTSADSYEEAHIAAYARAVRLRQFALVIEIECEKLTLEPDMFVKIDSHPDPAIPDNSVFRIVDEDGDAAGTDVRVTYTAGIEVYGT